MNRKTIYFIFFLFVAIVLKSCYKEEVVFEADPGKTLQLPVLLKLDGRACFYDSEFDMLRYSIREDVSDFSAVAEFADNTHIFWGDRELINGQTFNFGEIEVGVPYRVQIENSGSKKELDLVFTNNPIIQVICDSEIYDEPKSLARFKTSTSNSSADFSSFSGIEHRGKFTKYEDKRSIGFELWETMSSMSSYSAGLLGFKPNSDWILNSAVIDPSRIRNLVSFEIWNGLQGWNGAEAANYIGIQSQPAELFLNNRFQGLYFFSERINQQLLGAGNDAVLYKAEEWSDGATRFERFDSKMSINQFWNGWEQEIPDPDVEIDWKPLAELYDLVVESGESEFRERIADIIDIENFADYFLLLNLTSATDNTGKNVFLFKESEGKPFQIIPWDLDGSWGIIYDGSRIGQNNVLSNHLFARLIETNAGNFKTILKERWLFLRGNSFKEEVIIQKFGFWFDKLNKSDVIELENLVWDENLNLQDENAYIKSWTESRLSYLDDYFEQL